MTRHGIPTVTVRRGLPLRDEVLDEIGRELIAAGMSSDADSTAAARAIARVGVQFEQRMIDEFRRALAPHRIRVLVTTRTKATVN